MKKAAARIVIGFYTLLLYNVVHGETGNLAGNLTTKRTLSFIENKGQVHDQNNNVRPDIQYSLRAVNGLNIFIGSGTLHYQFSKADTSGQERNTTYQIPNPVTPGSEATRFQFPK